VIATSGEPAELVEIKLKRRQAATAEKNGRYDEAHTLYKNAEILAENYEIKTEGNVAALTADTLSSVAYTALFLREYQEALAAADRALELKPNNLFYMTNRAHALMFLGRDNEARELSLSNRSKKVSAHSWNYYIRQDFQALKAAGLTTPLMDEIEKQL
jgi:tetratricopeptide (TPR) repeat protein